MKSKQSTICPLRGEAWEKWEESREVTIMLKRMLVEEVKKGVKGVPHGHQVLMS